MIWLRNAGWSKCTFPQVLVPLLISLSQVNLSNSLHILKQEFKIVIIYSSMLHTVLKSFTRHLCRSHLFISERPSPPSGKNTLCTTVVWREKLLFIVNAWGPLCLNRSAEPVSCNITVLSSTAWRWFVAPSQKEGCLSWVTWVLSCWYTIFRALLFDSPFVPWKFSLC